MQDRYRWARQSPGDNIDKRTRRTGETPRPLAEFTRWVEHQMLISGKLSAAVVPAADARPGNALPDGPVRGQLESSVILSR